MSVWEYKVITSGKGGFATPALLETFLNQLGKEEWEILHFQSQPDNALAFTGLARRPTQRDWTLEDAVAAAARTEADKLRAEFAAKFKEGSGSAAEEKREPSAVEKADADDGYRKIRDTDRDLDPDSPEESAEAGDWEKLAGEDELPTFFEALRPHMRRNQRGPGMAVGVDYLAKKWQLTEAEVIGALKECGLAEPEDEDAEPVYVEYDGDLFWVNANRRGELWINTKEKPRPVFRVVQGQRVAAEEAGETGGHRREPAPHREESAAADAPAERREGGRSGPRHERPAPSEPGQPLPTGTDLLDKIAPLMRRSRRGSGASGSVSFLARALRCTEADLVAGFGALGLSVAEDRTQEAAPLEIGGRLWWLNHDQRGGVWINGDEKGAGDRAEPAPASESLPPPADAPEGSAVIEPRSEALPPAEPDGAGAPLAAVRLLLTPTKTGGFSAEVGRLAETLGKPRDEFLATLTGIGLKVPEKSREKPVFVEHGGEIFWLNRSAQDDLWLNAKASKYAGQDAPPGRRPPRSRGPKQPAVGEA
jgi:hypothetical protein